MKAQSVIDVILGEAVRGTKEQRYEDMLSIASVISNRASLSGKSMAEVIAHKSEFNAYGKALPAGTNSYRSLAEKALNEVVTKGPVHTGTYYATPQAAKGLPSGLTQVGRTTGHVYYADEQNRAFRTASGWAQPDPVKAEALRETVENRQLAMLAEVPTPTPRPDYAPAPRGMAALAPHGLVEEYGPNRPNRPNESIIDLATRAVKDVLGDEWSFVATSGREKAGRDYSGAGRHPTGNAIDGYARNTVTGEVASRTQMAQVAQQAAYLGATGVGFGKGYMDKDGIAKVHIDTARPSEPRSWGAAGTKATMDPEERAAIMGSMLLGVPAVDPNRGQVPTPQSRPGSEVDIASVSPAAGSRAAAEMQGAEIAAAPAAPATGPVGTIASELGFMPTPANASELAPDEALASFAAAGRPSAREAEEASMRSLAMQQDQVEAALEDAREARARDPNMDLAVAPVPTPAPVPAPAPAARQVAPALPQPVTIRDYPVAGVPQARTADEALSALPSGMHAISSLFDAPAGSRARSSGNPDITFEAMDDGRVAMTNQFGHTRALAREDYAHPTTPGPKADFANTRDPNVALGGPALSKGPGSFADFFGFGGKDKSGEKGKGMPAGKEIAGAVVGALLGNMALGPMGGALGAKLGSKVAGSGFFARSPLASLFGVGFPAAPAMPAGGLANPAASNLGYNDMASISPAAADAISRGEGGLY
jgi:hypothetical protein